MKVGFIQFDVKFGNKERNLDLIKGIITNEKADLWVLPELCNSGYLFELHEEVERLAEHIPDGETTELFSQLAAEKQTIIIAGLPEKSDNQFYNSAIIVDKNGLVGVYRKIHLFNEEKMWFQPGNLPFQVFEIDGVKLGVMICFDWIFPESMRTLALKGADIVCHPSNLVMPYCQDAMVTRCLENRVFAITANRIGTDVRENKELGFTGASQITDPTGTIIYQADKLKQEVKIIEIDPKQARNKQINPYNHLMNDLRPEMYQTNK